MHIIHRFNIEHKIIEENFNVEDLLTFGMMNFLGFFEINVDTDTNGCLQDIHWYGGDFGYFPTYSLGAIIAAQLMNKIKKKNTKV